jgi:hypothetical protein
MVVGKGTVFLPPISGFADRIFGYFAILLQVQVHGSGTISAPQILIFVDYAFISGYLSIIWRKNIGYFQP